MLIKYINKRKKCISEIVKAMKDKGSVYPKFNSNGNLNIKPLKNPQLIVSVLVHKLINVIIILTISCKSFTVMFKNDIIIKMNMEDLR